MFQSIITFLKKQNLLPHRIINANTYFFANAMSFLYKLSNWASFYVYLRDTLRSVTIRVYDKDWNNVFMQIVIIYGFTLIILIQL